MDDRNGLEVFARLEERQDAEQQRLLDQMVELRLRLALAEREQAALRRSQLSPKRKSEIIRSRGIVFYRGLPW